MPLDLALLGSKLRRYREQLSIDLSALSRATGIPEGTLQLYEQGQAEPTGDEILILADYYRCDYKFFISNERLAPFEQTEELYRKHGDAFHPEDRRAIQDFLFLCENEEFLMQTLQARRRPFSFQKRGRYYKRHAEEAAAALRRHLGLASHEVSSDVFSDFRSIGLHVFRRALNNSTHSSHPWAVRFRISDGLEFAAHGSSRGTMV